MIYTSSGVVVHIHILNPSTILDTLPDFPRGIYISWSREKRSPKLKSASDGRGDALLFSLKLHFGWHLCRINYKTFPMFTPSWKSRLINSIVVL